MDGLVAGAEVVVPCVGVLVVFVSWPIAAVPNSSTAAGNTVHFENWKLIIFSLSTCWTYWVLGNTQAWRKSCGVKTGRKYRGPLSLQSAGRSLEEISDL